MWHSAFCGTYFVGRLCKPPNRKKFEEDIAQCTDGIQTKEGQLVSTFFIYAPTNYNVNLQVAMLLRSMQAWCWWYIGPVVLGNLVDNSVSS